MDQKVRVKTKEVGWYSLIIGLLNGILCLFILTFDVRMKYSFELPIKKTDNNINNNNETNLHILNHIETRNKDDKIIKTSTGIKKDEILYLNNNLLINNQAL